MAVLQYVMYSKKSWSRSSGFDFFPSLSAGLMKAFHFVHIVLFLSFFSGQISRNRKKELWQLFLWPLWAIYVHIGPFLSTLVYFCLLWAISVRFGLFLSTSGHFCSFWMANWVVLNHGKSELCKATFLDVALSNSVFSFSNFSLAFYWRG